MKIYGLLQEMEKEVIAITGISEDKMATPTSVTTEMYLKLIKEAFSKALDSKAPPMAPLRGIAQVIREIDNRESSVSGLNPQTEISDVALHNNVVLIENKAGFVWAVTLDFTRAPVIHFLGQR